MVTFPCPRHRGASTIGGVPCRIFRPDGAPRAIYLHFHGGGMISGSAAMMDIPNQMTANGAGVTVVSVDYRKAPEFPYPAGPDDGVAVARELLGAVGAELGSDRMLIGGESAGGYMAAAVALRVRDELDAIDRVDRPRPHLRRARLERQPEPPRPPRRPTGSTSSSPEFVRLVAGLLPARTSTTDERRAPEISPAYADLRGLPPCFVERRHLRPLARRLADVRDPGRGRRA